jgi:hypothetical protein
MSGKLPRAARAGEDRSPAQNSEKGPYLVDTSGHGMHGPGSLWSVADITELEADLGNIPKDALNRKRLSSQTHSYALAVQDGKKHRP